VSNVLIAGDAERGLSLELAALSVAAGHYILKYHELKDNGEFGAHQVDLVLETAIADRGTKRSVAWDVHWHLESPKPTLIATLNASVAEVNGWLNGHDAHFFVGWAALPPLADAKVIEVMPGLKSDPAMVEKACEFWRSLGKEPVIVKDSTGGALPRVVASLINNAAYALMEGVASAEDIDQGMKLGMNYARGPLEWADLIGLDQVLGILNALHDVHGERYRPAPILRQLVDAGFWGKRTGRGFYEYK
jgi:3-hydroxybutyryl-CoA dehydrogenase